MNITTAAIHVPMQPMTRFGLFLVTLLTLSFTLLPGAFAQDPLKVVLVNVSKKGGSKVYKTFDGLLDASDDIQSKSPKKFLRIMDEEDIDKSGLRSGKKRRKSAKAFRTAMKDINAEAIMLVDVFSNGKKMQLVVIGPSGEQVADIRRKIKRGKIKKKDAKKVLGEAFGDLVPEVKEFRDEGGWDAYEEEEEVVEEDEVEEKEDDESDEGDEESEKDKALAKHAENALATGFSLKFGALLGSRSYTLEGADTNNDERFKLDHSSPFVGVSVVVETIFVTLGGGDSAIGARVFGGYAPFTTVFDEAQEFASDYARIGLDLKYVKAFSSSFILDVYGGAEAMSVTIEKNPFYTGNRYIAGRLGVYGNYIAGRIAVGAGGGVLPTFSVLNSDGAFGDAGFTLGFEAMAGISFLVTDAIDVGVNYDLQMVGPDYPDPVVVNESLISSDLLHTVNVLVGYRL